MLAIDSCMRAKQANLKYCKTVRRQVIRIVSNTISLDQVKRLEEAGFVVIMVIPGASPNKI